MSELCWYCGMKVIPFMIDCIGCKHEYLDKDPKFIVGNIVESIKNGNVYEVISHNSRFYLKILRYRDTDFKRDNPLASTYLPYNPAIHDPELILLPEFPRKILSTQGDSA